MQYVYFKICAKKEWTWNECANQTFNASKINLTSILDSEANHWKLQSLSASASWGNPKLKLEGNRSQEVLNSDIHLKLDVHTHTKESKRKPSFENPGFKHCSLVYL